MVSAGRSLGEVAHVHSPEEGTGSNQKTYQLRTRGVGAGKRRPFLEDLTAGEVGGYVTHVHSPEEGTGSIRKTY